MAQAETVTLTVDKPRPLLTRQRLTDLAPGLVFVAIMVLEADNTLLSRMSFFASGH